MNSIENHDNWETFPANKLESACWTFSYLWDFKFYFLNAIWFFRFSTPSLPIFVVLVQFKLLTTKAQFLENVEMWIVQHTFIYVMFCTILRIRTMNKDNLLSSTRLHVGLLLNYNFFPLPSSCSLATALIACLPQTIIIWSEKRSDTDRRLKNFWTLL